MLSEQEARDVLMGLGSDDYEWKCRDCGCRRWFPWEASKPVVLCEVCSAGWEWRLSETRLAGVITCTQEHAPGSVP
jgi:hypothetical protein